MADSPSRAVEAHYDELLGERYTWMMGGSAACQANARALFDAAGIVAQAGDIALDLGAGAGFHARTLAERGFEVIAVDSNVALLHEIAEVCAGFGVAPVYGHLLDDRAYRSRAPFALILCVGDTLAHLGAQEEVSRLIDLAAALLAPGGALLLQFREQTQSLRPQDCSFVVRSERDRIMECILHFEADRVWVTDVVHEWGGQLWRTIRSTYPKLRLSVDEIVTEAKAAGLTETVNTTIARQRLLVFRRMS
jgi:cyclopropane fatty-acyl-phospholipid synthase-like methyltransferase